MLLLQPLMAPSRLPDVPRLTLTVLRGAALCLFSVGCVSHTTAPLQERVDLSRRESDPVQLQARATNYARVGDYTRAAQYLEAALSRGGDPNAILPQLVGIQIKDHNYRAAAQHLRERLRSHPSDERARFVLASLWSALEQPREAEREFLRILADSPTHTEATFALAVLYRDYLFDAQNAQLYFQRYLALAPLGRHRDEAEDSSFRRVP